MTTTTMPKLTEKAWQASIVKTAKQFGWSVFHPQYSIGSAPGYPDLTLVRPPRIIFAELKNATGKVSPRQQEWLDLLGDCDGVETFLWRAGTDDLEDIARILMGEKEPSVCPECGRDLIYYAPLRLTHCADEDCSWSQEDEDS